MPLNEPISNCHNFINPQLIFKWNIILNMIFLIDSVCIQRFL